MKNMYKHLTAITKTASAGRPILQGIYMDAINNKMVVCDGTRAMTVNSPFKLSDSSVVNPETLEEIEGVYPDTSRIVNKELTIAATFKITKTFSKLLSALKTDDYIYLRFLKNKIDIMDRDKKITIGTIDTNMIDAPFAFMAFRPKLFIELMAAINDSRSNEFKMYISRLSIGALGIECKEFDYVLASVRV